MYINQNLNMNILRMKISNHVVTYMKRVHLHEFNLSNLVISRGEKIRQNQVSDTFLIHLFFCSRNAATVLVSSQYIHICFLLMCICTPPP